jgi:hypothetical protein
VTRRLTKSCPILSKSSPKQLPSQKGQKIYIKSVLNFKTLTKTSFETAWLHLNVTILLASKVAQREATFLRKKPKTLIK